MYIVSVTRVGVMRKWIHVHGMSVVRDHWRVLILKDCDGDA